MPITANMNKKGGDGKTSLTANLGAELSKTSKVLLIDSDEQGNLSSHLNVEEFEYSITDLYEEKPFEVTVINENLHIIPADDDFVGMDLKIQSALSRETFLKRALDKIKDDYDYIFIDCPPNIGLITINALAASDFILMPVEPAGFSLKGAQTMVSFITKVKAHINNDLELLGIVLNKYTEKHIISRLVLKEFEKNGWNAALFNTRIRHNVAIKTAQFFKKTIFEHDAKCNAAQDYQKLAIEFTNKIKLLYGRE